MAHGPATHPETDASTAAAVRMAVAEPPLARPARRSPAWVREVVMAVVFYGLYTLSRDLQGSATVSYAHALTNAEWVISVERHLGILHEAAIQQALIGHRILIETANVFYGSLHMVITVIVLVVMFRRDRVTYRRARNALAVITGLALVGFVAFPTVPPRLLPSTFGLVDTLARFGTLWWFDSGAVAKLSNQYAAMPSLHCAWALWCAISLASVLHHRTARVAVYLYPLLTLTVVVATANHFILDAVAGGAIVAVGEATALRLPRRRLAHGHRQLDAA